MNKEWNPHNTSIHKMNKKGDPQSAHVPRMRGGIINAHKQLYILLAPKWIRSTKNIRKGTCIAQGSPKQVRLLYLM